MKTRVSRGQISVRGFGGFACVNMCTCRITLPHLLRRSLAQTASGQRGPQFADVHLPVFIQVQLPEDLGISPVTIRVRDRKAVVVVVVVGTSTAGFCGDQLLVFSHVKVKIALSVFNVPFERNTDLYPSAGFARFYVANVTAFDRSS